MSNTAMTDRERIARIIENNRHYPVGSDQAGEYADAVLEVIGDRLLPNIPDGWKQIRIFPGPRGVDLYVNPYDDLYERFGSGRSIAAALTNAYDDEEADR